MGGGPIQTAASALIADKKLSGSRPERYNFPSQPKANPDAIVTGGKGSKYRFTVLTSRLLRYEWSADGTFEDRASIFAPFRYFDKPEFRVVENERDKTLEVITEFFHLVYDRKEFTSAGLAVTVNAPNVSAETWRYDGLSYGDLGGTARTLDGVDGRTELEPGILSRGRPFAVVDDSVSMILDEDGWVASRVEGRKDGYIFAYGRDYKAAMKDFYRLSGRQPILPRWALGNWWSRYHAYDADEYLGLMDRFKKEGIPIAVGVVDMDWHRVEDVPRKYGSGWTGYSWNRDLFPDPEGFLKEIHKRGLKVALNDHPADGVRAYEDQYQEVAKYLDFDTSHEDPIRFDCTDRSYIDAYLDVLWTNLEKQGVDFCWIDWQQGRESKIPNIDPLWVLNHYHYLTSKRSISNLGEPMTFSRFAGPGSHRYPIGFSGDTLITWATLHFQPEFTATASNIGYGWWSHDIGGHYWGTRSNELTTRWVQLGCFSPILRLHSEKSQWNSKEPWKYEPDAREVMEIYLVLRHKLIPFLYTMSVRAALEGEPLVQPMYWNHSENEEAYRYPNEYYFGPDLIIAPITSPHSPATLMGSVKAWLPKGRYVDLTRAQLVYDGDRELTFHRELLGCPVLARQGTVLPMDISPIKGNGAPLPTHFNVIVIVGTDGSFELVEEDEKMKHKAEKAADDFIRTPIRWDQHAGKLTVGPASRPTHKKRTWTVTLTGHTDEKTTAALTLSDSSFSSSKDVKFTQANYRTKIELGTHSDAAMLTLQLAPNPQLDIVDIPARVHEVLYRAETIYPDKTDIWQIVAEDDRPLHVRSAALYELDVDEDLRSAVIEIWFADGRALEKGMSEFKVGADIRPVSDGFMLL
jgi:alpha-glucosidase (family GH31 glycosyl hydrolase)